jgi:hypothetical protein
MEDEGAGVEGTDGEKLPGHAPLVTKGHSIGLQSKNTEVAFNLPRMASDTGLQLICDPGENYEMFPEMSRIFYSRRALVVHLLKLLVTLNKWYSTVTISEAFRASVAVDSDHEVSLLTRGMPHFHGLFWE